MSRLPPILALLIILAACGGSPTTPTPSRCLDVPAALIRDIEAGLTVQGGGTLRAESVQAVKSTSYEKVYFIAAEIQGQGMESANEIGVWASNALESGQGMILSVNSIAAEFSTWPKGADTKANISPSDDGVQESMDCLEVELNK